MVRFGGAVPFSSITDPDRLAVVCAAFDRAWSELVTRDSTLMTDDFERQRLAYIVASTAATDVEGDLVTLSIQQFLAGHRPPQLRT